MKTINGNINEGFGDIIQFKSGNERSSFDAKNELGIQKTKEIELQDQFSKEETSKVVNRNFENPLDQSKCNDFMVKESRSFQLSYEFVIWFIFSIVTTLCIVDRFVNQGDAVLGRKGKRLSRMWGKNAGETMANVIWGITARLIITSQNMMFYTTLWCIPNGLAELAPGFLSITGIRDIHMKIHRIVGIFLIGIPSIAHVLVIFLPPLVDRTQLTYSPPSTFNYSKQLGNLNWTKIWDPAAVENWTFNDSKGVHLTSDEIYRFVLVIALFCFLIPLSRSRFLNNRSYSLAMSIHCFAGVWYAIDNIRKITHGLAHVFNLPILLIWCIDRLFSIVYYRKSVGTAKANVIGDNEYLMIRVKLNKQFEKNIGDVYYLLNEQHRTGFLSPERSHPFTSFSNHDVNDPSWDIGFIISIMPDDTQWFPSWTRRLRIQDRESQVNKYLKCWGPYRSAVCQIYADLERNEKTSFLLLASGSGFGYLLDVLSVLANKNFKKNDGVKIPNIQIHYTVACIGVYQNFVQEVQHHINVIKERKTAKVTFTWYSTKSAEEDYGAQTFNDINLFHGKRVDYEKVIKSIESKSTIYFVGRPSIADHIGKLCEKYNHQLIKDFSNSQRGSSDKQLMVKYLKYTLYVLFAVVASCILFSIYVRI